MQDDKQDTKPSPDHAKAACATPAEKRSSRAQYKDWPRLKDERAFGSITGAELRVWGEE